MKRTMLILVAVIAMAGLSNASPMSDGSILSEEFAGTALDTNTWEVYATAAPVVAGGEVKLDSIASNGVSSIRTKAGIMGTAQDTWVAETRFIFRDISTPKTYRQVFLMTALSGGFGSSDAFEAIGFDLRLRQTYGNTYLAWHGYDNTDLGRVGEGMGMLNPNQYYTVKAVIRSLDSEVDIYLDDVLLDTKALLVGSGTGNVGQIYPDYIIFGSSSGDAKMDMSLDYVSVGVPEPASIALLGIGACFSLVRRRKK